MATDMMSVNEILPINGMMRRLRQQQQRELTMKPLVSMGLAFALVVSLMSQPIKQVDSAFAASASGLQISGAAATLGRPSAGGRNIMAMSGNSLKMGTGSRVSGSASLQMGQSLGVGSASNLGAATHFSAQKNWAQGDHSDLDNYYEQWFSSSVLGGMAPPECYSNLMKRYNKWAKNYKAMQKASGGSGTMSQSVEDVVSDVFSRLGQSLVEEECPNGGELGEGDASGDTPNSDPNNTDNHEMVDFVYKALKKAINKLDNILDMYKKLKGFVEDVVLNQDGEDEPEDQMERAGRLLERVKQKAISEAQKFAKIKIKGMAQQKAMESLSNYMTNGMKVPGEPLSYLKPMLEASNSNSIQMVVDTLTNFEFRGAIALINQQKPLDFLKCKKDDNNEPYC